MDAQLCFARLRSTGTVNTAFLGLLSSTGDSNFSSFSSNGFSSFSSRYVVYYGIAAATSALLRIMIVWSAVADALICCRISSLSSQRSHVLYCLREVVLSCFLWSTFPALTCAYVFFTLFAIDFPAPSSVCVCVCFVTCLRSVLRGYGYCTCSQRPARPAIWRLCRSDLGLTWWCLVTVVGIKSL